MILLLIVLVIASAIVLWIAWLPVGPDYGTGHHPFAIKSSMPSDAERPSRANDESYRQHLHTRMETNAIPLGAVAGFQAMTHVRGTDRGRLHPPTVPEQIV